MTIDFKGLDKNKYSRSLNLSKGFHTVLSMGAKSECFSSFPDKISVYKITSAKPFNAVIGAKSKLKSKTVSENGSLFLLGNAPDYAAPNYLRTELYPIRYNEKKGMAFCLQTLIKSNGKITQNKASFKIENASELTLYFVTKTGFNGFDKMPETSTNKVKQNCMAKMSTVDKDFELLKSLFSAVFAYCEIYSYLAFRLKCFDKIIYSVKLPFTAGFVPTAVKPQLYYFAVFSA